MHGLESQITYIYSFLTCKAVENEESVWKPGGNSGCISEGEEASTGYIEVII